MVRFENKLTQNAVKEWAEHYVDYRLLKRLLTQGDDRVSGSIISPLSPRLARSLVRVSLFDDEENHNDSVDGAVEESDLRRLIIDTTGTSSQDKRFRKV
jgi:SPX domain protein involved in polyphosphate accumulation